LILFIEDADRAGSGFDSRHLERLLFSLRSVQRISFVLSFDHPYVIALSKEARSRLAAEPGDTARTADPSKE
jgi:hypothetical protein